MEEVTIKRPDMKVFSTYPDVLSVEQMSEALGISTKTAYKLLKDGSIEHFKVGRTYKIPKPHLLSFIGLA